MQGIACLLGMLAANNNGRAADRNCVRNAGGAAALEELKVLAGRGGDAMRDVACVAGAALDMGSQ